MIQLKHNSKWKALFIDDMCQGIVMNNGDIPNHYMKPISERLAGLDKGSEALFIGLGFGILPKWFTNKQGRALSLELDPEVIKVTEAHQGPLNVIQGNALETIKDLELEWFDFILLDVWPNHANMYCIDYFIECKRHLKKGKTFAVNYIADNQADIDKMGKSLAAVFASVKSSVYYTDKEMTTPTQVVYFCND
jgi:spermidine synthase